MTRETTVIYWRDRAETAEAQLAALQEIISKAENGKYGSIIKEWIAEALRRAREEK